MQKQLTHLMRNAGRILVFISFLLFMTTMILLIIDGERIPNDVSVLAYGFLATGIILTFIKCFSKEYENQ
jgi:hypothetical protein